MSIFSKQLTSLDFEGIQELQASQARENIRLEFKREIPGKDETLKKLSALANTYGGYLVIGIAEDGQGNIASIDGVEPERGYRQKIVQWCFDGLFPPLSPEVSEPIPLPTNADRVLYVLYVPLSHEAPHFINNRGGCYIRTDEFSQRFEGRLATYEEIEHLANRRQAAVELRGNIIARAKARLDEHIAQNYRSRPNVTRDIDVTMWLAILPQFPERGFFRPEHIQHALSDIQLRARGTSFPNGMPQAQHEGFYFPDPRVQNFSYLQIDMHGLIFYAEELGHIQPETELEEGEEPSPEDIYLYVSWILAWTIFYLRFANDFYRNTGYQGSLLFHLGLDRIRGRQFRIALNSSGTEFDQGRPMLDNSITVTHDVDTQAISGGLMRLAADLFRQVSFSCGWSRAYSASDEFIDAGIDRALGYLMWSRGDLSS